jgi:hypothetical protein
MRINLSVSFDEPSPQSVAQFLQTIAEIPRVQMGMLVACDSVAQAGQFRRRVREKLEDVGGVSEVLGDQLEYPSGSPHFELTLPVDARNRNQEPDDDDEQQVAVNSPRSPLPTLTPPPPRPTISAAQGPPPPPPGLSRIPSLPPPHQAPPLASLRNPLVSAELPEGNFKVRLGDVVKDQSGGKLFVTLKLEVLEGPRRSTKFDDRVIVWPISERTDHVARALGLDKNTLGQTIDTAIGKQFWVRRKEVVRPDGALRMINYYFPADTPPPPDWAGYNR